MVSRLAMCHTRVFSLRMLEIPKRCIVSPFLKCPQVSHAKKIFLREKCVDVRLLTTSCTFLRLQLLAVRCVTVAFSVNRCILSPSLKCPRGCPTRGKYFYMQTTWMWDCCWYHVVFFYCIVSHLAMCHSRLFSLGTLEILNGYIVSPSLKCPRECPTRGKYFDAESCVDDRLLSISCSFLSLHRLGFSDVSQSRFQSTRAYLRPL